MYTVDEQFVAGGVHMYMATCYIDNICLQVSHFYQYWSTAKVKGFEVYVCELDVDVEKCAERNVHKRSLDEIKGVCMSTFSHVTCCIKYIHRLRQSGKKLHHIY